MDFKWGWLGRGKTTREPKNSDEDKNPKHRRHTWAEMVKDSPAAQATGHPVPASSVKSTIDPKATYTGEQVTAMLKRVTKSDGSHIREEDTGGPWTEVRSRGSLRKPKAIMQPNITRKRKLSPPGSDSSEQCWICGKRGHFKDECPFIRCRFCKVLGHMIAECPLLPEKQSVSTSNKEVDNRSARPQKPRARGSKVGQERSRPDTTRATKNGWHIQVWAAKAHPAAKIHTVKKNNILEMEDSKETKVKSIKTKEGSGKPSMFLPTSDKAAEDRKSLSKIIGVVYPGHGNPSVDEMIGGRRLISVAFAHHDWNFSNAGRYYLARFPSQEGLDHAVGRTSILCCNHNAGFTVYRWTGQEDDQVQIFPTTTTIGIQGLPLHHWNKNDLSKIVVRFAHLIDVEDDTLERRDLVTARIRIGCDSADSISKEIKIVVGGQLRIISIKIIDMLSLPLKALNEGRAHRERRVPQRWTEVRPR